MDNLELATSFFNSSFFVALVTLLVGIIAIRLYILQQLDQKSDAAKLILQEIRYAEQVFRQATTAGLTTFPLYQKMLPTNNWNKNIHLFIHELEETELDLISRLYSTSLYIDHLVSKISDLKTQKSEPNIFQQQLIQPKITFTEQQQPIQINNLNLMHEPNAISFEELQVMTLLQIVCAQMEPVYNTPTGEKLKRLSKRTKLFFKLI